MDSTTGTLIWVTALFAAIALLIKGLVPHPPPKTPIDETEEEWLDRQL